MIREYIDSVGGTDSLSADLERPRFQLLSDACKADDFFYIALHQIFCLWTNNRQSITNLENFCESRTVASAFRILAQLIRENDHLSPDHLSWLCEFPSPLADLMRRSDHYHKTVMNVAYFLTRLATEWVIFTAECQQRGYPPLVDEMIQRLGLLSPILQGVVFTATRRNLSIGDDYFGVAMEKLFVQDKEGHKKLALRCNTPYPPTVKEIDERNTQLVQRYREVLEQHRQQRRLSLNPLTRPNSNSPVIGSNGPHFSPAHSPQIQQEQFGLPQRGAQATYGNQQQFAGQHPNRRGSIAVVSNGTMSPNPQYYQVGQFTQPHFAGDSLRGPATMAGIPPQHARALNNPSNQGGNVSQSPVQHLPVQAPVFQQPDLISRSQTYNRSSVSEAASGNRYQRPSQQMYASQYRHPSQHIQQSHPQQARQPQMLSQLQPQIQMDMSHHMRANSQGHDISQRALSNGRQGTSPASQNVGGAQQVNIPQVMAQTSAGHIVHPAVGTQQNPPHPPVQTTALPYTEESVQYYGLMDPGKRPLIPPHGYVHPVQGPPNPELTALHQAHLRSPHLQIPQSALIPGQDTNRMRHYQTVIRLALGPSILPLEQTVFKERFEISTTDHARIAVTKGIGKDSAPVRDASAGSLQYRLRCSRLKNPVPTFSEPEWIISETAWPESIFLEINATPLEIRRKSQHGKDMAVDITPYVTSGQNELKVVVMRVGKAKESIAAVAIEVVEVLRHDQIVDMCLKSHRIPADKTLNTIKAVLTGAGLDDDEIAMQASDLTIDLADPFTARIFDIPVRSATCVHRECFDLETFLQTRNSKPRRPMQPCMVDVWKCPLCGRDARPHTLLVDDFLVEVRKRLEEQGMLDFKAIIVAADGSWRPKPVVGSLKRSLKDSADDSEGDDENLYANGVNKKVKASAEPAKVIEVIELDDD